MDTADKTRALTDGIAFNPLNAKDLIETFGLLGVWAIMFAETGLMVGFFLPGDSLLFVAGIAASGSLPNIKLSIVGLLIGAPVFAIAGAQLGHHLGARYGRRLFARPDSRLFKQEYVEKAEHYFVKFGPAKAVVLARFIPIVRTFLNPVAGVLAMPARQFLLWNIVGGILWTDGVLLAGYALGGQITKVIPAEKLDTYLLPGVVVIVLLSAMPIFIEIWRERRSRRRARAGQAGADARAEVRD